MRLNLRELQLQLIKVSTSTQPIDNLFASLSLEKNLSKQLEIIWSFHSSMNSNSYLTNCNYANLRDFGFLCAKITKHKENLSSFYKFLEILSYNGKILDEVPRDTVFTYGPMNSTLVKRVFTPFVEENLFIDAFTSGMYSLFECLDELSEIYNKIESNPIDDVIAFKINNANNKFKGMVSAIKQIHLKISPQIFTYELRPYFEPFWVDGVSYNAPGGAGMPVLLVDQILWSNEFWSKFYEEYFKTNLKYLPKKLRQASEEFQGKSTIRQLIKVRQLKLSEIAFGDFCKTLLIFRGIHKKVADSNFELRPDGSLGSGGETPDQILQLLVAKTFQLKQNKGE